MGAEGNLEGRLKVKEEGKIEREADRKGFWVRAEIEFIALKLHYEVKSYRKPQNLTFRFVVLVLLLGLEVK